MIDIFERLLSWHYNNKTLIIHFVNIMTTPYLWNTGDQNHQKYRYNYKKLKLQKQKL